MGFGVMAFGVYKGFFLFFRAGFILMSAFPSFLFFFFLFLLLFAYGSRSCVFLHTPGGLHFQNHDMYF